MGNNPDTLRTGQQRFHTERGLWGSLRCASNYSVKYLHVSHCVCVGTEHGLFPIRVEALCMEITTRLMLLACIRLFSL